jgi:uncharacterized membrane protein YfcA/TolB-like protein
MPDIRVLLLAAIGVLAVLFVARWWQSARSADTPARWPTPVQLLIGFLVSFFDTLGIGSLATTTTTFKALRMVPDERLPGTMIVGLTLPVVVQALIFISAIQIDPTLLALMIATAIAGGWLGAGIVSRLPRRPIQIGMGVALLLAAVFMTVAQLNRMPVGGTALALSGSSLWLALGVNFVLGALIMLGIGNYGPTFVLLSALGMDPRAAFPIMMGSGAFAALLGCLEFVKRRNQVDQPALGLAIGGVPGVLVAALLVTSLPLAILKWLVISVIVYAAAVMLRSALRPAVAPVVAGALLLLMARPAQAQCPDGSPPPCRTATRPARSAPVSLNPRGWIVVPFTNVTRTPELEWLRDGAVNLLSTDLAKWNDLSVVPDKRVADLLRTVPAVKAGQPLSLSDGLSVARSAGAAQLVMGDVFKLGAGARIVANVFDARTGEKLRSVTQVVPVVDSIFGLMGTVARGVLAMAPPPNAKTGDIGTTRVDAYEAYLRGVRAMYRMQYEVADTALRQAVRLDSTFALAHRALAQTLQANFGTLGTNEERRRHALAAQRFARNLSKRDQALVEATAAAIRGDAPARCAAVAPLIAADSSDVEAWIELAACLTPGGPIIDAGTSSARWTNSAHRVLLAHERVLRLDPTYFPAFNGILNLLLSSGRRYACAACPAGQGIAPYLWIADTLDVRPIEDSARVRLRAQQQREFRNARYAQRVAEQWYESGGGRRAALGLAETLLLSGRADSAFTILAKSGLEYSKGNLPGTVLALDVAWRSNHLDSLRVWLDSARKVYRRLGPTLYPRTESIAIVFGHSAMVDSVLAANSALLGRTFGLDSALIQRYRVHEVRVSLGLPAPGLTAAESLLVVSLPESCARACRLRMLDNVLQFSSYVRRSWWPDTSLAPTDVGLLENLRGDTAALRRLAEANERALHEVGVGEFGNNVRLAYSLWLSVADSVSALRVARYYVDSVFVRSHSAGRTDYVEPALELRLMRLRAELAAALGYKAEARKWLDYLLSLWTDVDPWLKLEVDRLKALRAKVAG